MMNRNRVMVVLVSLMSILALLLAGCGKPKQTDPKGSSTGILDVGDEYVGTVGGEKVSKPEFYYFLNQTKQNMETQGLQGGSKDAATFWSTKIDGKDPKVMAEEYALAQLQQFKTGYILAKKGNVALSAKEKEDAQKKFDDLVSQNGGKEGFSTLLKTKLNISYEEYAALNERFNLVDKFFKTTMEAIDVNSADVSKYYNDNKANLETVTVSHVLFLTVDANTNQPLPQDKQEMAKKNADEVLAKVNAGEDIKAIAVKRSEDPGVKQNNGEYVFARNGQMVKEFEDWGFSNAVGATGIVKTAYGYHVVKKTAQATAQDALASAKKQVQQTKFQSVMEGWKKDPTYQFIKNEKVYKTLKQ